MARLKTELRTHIRFLGDFAILSSDWLKMAESLQQIASVAFMETHLPPSEENPLQQAGKKTHGTLWDQPKDEIAVRILLEEGKLNLLLRMLHKYRTTSRGDKWGDMLTACAKQFNSDPTAVAERCRTFETSLGILLRFALNHVEAVQILDLAEFFQHAEEVLNLALKSDKSTVEHEKLQETMLVYYLSSIGQKLEELDEDKVMEQVKDHKCFSLLVDQLNKHLSWYRVDTLEAAAKALNGFMTSDSYGAERKAFVPDQAAMKQIVNLKGLFLHELLNLPDGMKKKDVQKLLDEITQFEKQVGAAKLQPLQALGCAPKKEEGKSDKTDKPGETPPAKKA